MRRLAGIAAAAIAAAAGGAVPPHAYPATDCGRAVVADWVADGRLDRIYEPACYRDALAQLPDDVRTYTSAADDIRHALVARIRAKAASRHADVTRSAVGRNAGRSSSGKARSPAHTRSGRAIENRGPAPEGKVEGPPARDAEPAAPAERGGGSTLLRGAVLAAILAPLFIAVVLGVRRIADAYGVRTARRPSAARRSDVAGPLPPAR